MPQDSIEADLGTPHAVRHGQSRTCVLVLGMHRSGTSALARAVSLLGADLPKNILGPRPGNERGHWEPEPLVLLHDRILAELGSRWDDWRVLSLDGVGRPRQDEYKRQISELLEREFGAAPLIVLKEPRICRLVPLYREILAGMGFAPRFVLPLRNPLAVTASLEQRDGMTASFAALLWLRHVLDAEAETRNSPRAIVSYEALLADWRPVLRTVGARIGLVWPRPLEEAAGEISEFLSAKLQHFAPSRREVAARADISTWVKDAYASLLRLAKDPDADAAFIKLDRIKTEFDSAAATFGPAMFGELAVREERLGRARDEHAAAATGLRATVAADEQEIARLHAASAEHARTVEELRGMVAAREAELAALKEAAAESTGAVKALQEALGTRVVENGDLRAEIAVRDQQLEALQAAAGMRKEEVAGLRVELAARASDLVGMQADIAVRDQQLEALQAAAGMRKEEVAGLRVELAARASDLAGMQADIAVRDQQLEALQAAAGMRKEEVAGLRVELAARASDLAGMQADIAVRDQQPHAPQTAIAAREDELARLQQNVTAREAEVQALTCDVLAARTDAQSHLRQLEVERDENVRLRARQESDEADKRLLLERRAELERMVAGLNRTVIETSAQLSEILASNSWRFSKPLRALRWNFLITPYRGLRRTLSRCARWAWLHVPLSARHKQGLKDTAFLSLPIVFGRTKAYRAWKAYRPPVAEYSTATNSELEAGPENTAACEFIPLRQDQPPASATVKLIAFYLPQFHTIPENDAWWGRGFTEWTNVAPARPMFVGHYQPHIPGELGFYNLLDTAVQRRQVELAKLYGISGFCFYFYWFGGKRLLESPIENYLGDETLQLPFCLCWANENWTRRWDGLDTEILIGQEHSAADDLAFIEHVSRYMRNNRYIRVNGRPLLIVYRPSLLPSARDTANRWRKWCRDSGIGEIYLAYTQSFENVDPAQYGFDAAIEFPPNNSAPPNITKDVTPLCDDFGCSVFDWTVFVERSENYQTLEYQLFRSVCPWWDNTPRRKRGGAVFLNSTPALYQRWLENAVSDSLRNPNTDERIVFINAWNEWAEGAHLEPDTRYGYAWLDATRRALEKFVDCSRSIVVVTHDAHPHGAQYIALNMVRTLATTMGFKVATVCLGDGSLKEQFEAHGRFHDLAGRDPRGKEAHDLAQSLRAAGYCSAIVNTTVSGRFLATLTECGIRCVALVHELGGILRSYDLEEHARTIAQQADTVVFGAQRVHDDFVQFAGIEPRKVENRAQGLCKRNAYAGLPLSEPRERLRNNLGLSPDSVIVLGVGYADYRKGIDLFVEAGRLAVRRNQKLHYVWVGHWCSDMDTHIKARLQDEPELASHFHFVGRQDDTDLFYAGANLFALTSREDPFPSVVLEAMEVGLPIVAFSDGGGYVSLLEEGPGITVPMEDTSALAGLFVKLAEAPAHFDVCRQSGPKLIRERFSFHDYLYDLCAWAGLPLKRVSVIVPNYNYERYIVERITSIQGQTYPIYEIIFLDDASTDRSMSLARGQLAKRRVPYSIAANERNSGSVFAQWKRGCEMARGEYIWIAEADDLSAPTFLETVMRGFDDPGVVLSYCESQQIDEAGTVMARNYHEYVSDIGSQRWYYPYTRNGIDEIRECLAIKNTIPNVSGVVMKRAELNRALHNHFKDISSYRIAGDWKTYLHLLSQGRVAFHPEPLNLHRRHQSSVTISSFNQKQLSEIQAVQEWAATEFNCGEPTQLAARHYLNKLRKQFGIAQLSMSAAE